MSYTTTREDLNGIESYRSDSSRNLNWSSVFILPAWLKVWWQVFRPAAEAYISVVQRDGKTIGIAPLMVREETAFFIGNTDVCDYLDFITAPGEEEGFFNTLLDELKKEGIRRLDLKNVREDAVVLTRLAPVARGRRCDVVETQEDVTVEMELPAAFEQYLEGLDGKQRHEVRRKLRRLAAAGDINFRFVDNRADVPAVLDNFFKMFVESRSDKAHFLTSQMSDYFRMLADALAELKLLKIGVLELDGKSVAEIMCFDYNDTIYLYNSGYDPEYTSISAGLLSKVFAVKDSIEKGRKCFDFLKGAETYKYHLGGHAVPLYRCQVSIN
jgi:CelD/BcsL family acetyltransferase involved in cellulose biosynthesis